MGVGVTTVQKKRCRRELRCIIPCIEANTVGFATKIGDNKFAGIRLRIACVIPDNLNMANIVRKFIYVLGKKMRRHGLVVLYCRLILECENPTFGGSIKPKKFQIGRTYLPEHFSLEIWQGFSSKDDQSNVRKVHDCRIFASHQQERMQSTRKGSNAVH